MTTWLQSAYQYLNKMQQGHSKMDGLEYTKFYKAAYLSSPLQLFNSEDIRELLALRTRNLEGILDCSVIKEHHKSGNVSHSDKQYIMYSHRNK